VGICLGCCLPGHPAAPPSPHAWGSFRGSWAVLVPQDVFPTRVGVCHGSPPPSPNPASLPHTRGGLSTFPRSTTIVLGCSPHTHGGFSQVWGADHVQPRLPYTCGGRSFSYMLRALMRSSSPHTWESVQHAGKDGIPAGCPPHARGGLPPVVEQIFLGQRSLPHVRGRLSDTSAGRSMRPHSSPCTWGYIVSGLGAPDRPTGSSPRSWGSVVHRAAARQAWPVLPHTWGSVRGVVGEAFFHAVFPTYVGVCPAVLSPARDRSRLPHVRGGLAICLRRLEPHEDPSPRTWEAGRGIAVASRGGVLFPT
jgi:hypothetical protein